MTETRTDSFALSASSCDNGTPATGRADGCANTNIGPGRSTKEIDVGSILPSAADTPQPPSPTESERMSRVDGCPDCVANTEAPYRTEDEGDGFRAYYGCEDCGYFWNTGWGI